MMGWRIHKVIDIDVDFDVIVHIHKLVGILFSRGLRTVSLKFIFTFNACILKDCNCMVTPFFTVCPHYNCELAFYHFIMVLRGVEMSNQQSIRTDVDRDSIGVDFGVIVHINKLINKHVDVCNIYIDTGARL